MSRCAKKQHRKNGRKRGAMITAKCLTATEIAELPHGGFAVAKCEDTQRFALYRKFLAQQEGAMTGLELVAHEDEFARLRDGLNAFYIYD